MSCKKTTSVNVKWSKIICAIYLSLCFLTMNAQDNSENKNESNWNFNIAPYILFPYMNGDVAIKGIPIDVSVDPGDIFSNLDFGAMLYFEASNSKWVIAFDGLYMDLSQKGETPLTSREARVDIDQIGLTLSGRYRVTEWADVGIGARLNSIGSGVKVAPGDYILPGTNFSMNETWVDPIIIARVMTRFQDSKWRLGLTADIGGFGIGSDFAWQVNPFAGYQFSNLFELGAAYRWLGMKYESGSGTDYFLYDVTTSGPEVRLSFYF